MIKRQIHFKNYSLAVPLINEIKTDYNVHSHLTRSSENGLLVTFDIDEENLDSYLELVEQLRLETY